MRAIVEEATNRRSAWHSGRRRHWCGGRMLVTPGPEKPVAQLAGSALLLACSYLSLLAAPAIRQAGPATGALAAIAAAVVVLALAGLLSSKRASAGLIAYGLIVAAVAVVAALSGQRLVAGIVMLSAGPTIAAMSRRSTTDVDEVAIANRLSSPLATAVAGAVVFAVLLEATRGVASQSTNAPLI